MEQVKNNRVLIHIENGQLLDILIEAGSSDDIYVVDDGYPHDRIARKHPMPNVSELIDGILSGDLIDEGRPITIRDIVQPDGNDDAGQDDDVLRKATVIPFPREA